MENGKLCQKEVSKERFSKGEIKCKLAHCDYVKRKVSVYMQRSPHTSERASECRYSKKKKKPLRERSIYFIRTKATLLSTHFVYFCSSTYFAE